ncbi:M56 family metallopeptidase [Cellvibrio sp. NN19]|uniref:M56 family metallopeptidase n=1 Tax=Cellvibrio chitinivorans TaxID=3102792 RepID=UPI002B40F9C6|nr:M56 family metallopeptidase [Cellvibrio sp. NN19]
MDALMEGLNAFTAWLLLTSVKSVFLIALILLIQYRLKKYLSAKARHSIWLSLLICLCIPVGWNLSFDQQHFTFPTNTPVEKSTETEQLSNQITSIENNTTTQPDASTTIEFQPTNESIETTIHHHSIFSFVWLSGLCFFILVTAWQVRHFNLILRKATQASPQQHAQLESYKKTLKVNQKIALVYSDQITCPLTLGLIKSTIVLPMDIERQLSSEELKLVFLHELTHIQRKDILWNWIAHCITLLHWFNPLIWIANKRIRADMEMACDEELLAQLSATDRHEYGMTLIKVSQFVSRPQAFSNSLGILENHRELKNRLIMIKEYTTMNLKKSLVFGLVMSTFTLVALAQPKTNPNTQLGNTDKTAGNFMTLAEFAQHAEKDLKTQILIGQQYANFSIPVNLSTKSLDYGMLLSQLKINEFTAYKTSGYIQIIPASDARWLAIPTVEKGKTYFDDEYVTDSIKLEKACAGSVLASLRPLVPKYGHLTAMESANTLIISDFFSNIVRLKAMIKTLEDNTPTKVDCSNRSISAKKLPIQPGEKK